MDPLTFAEDVEQRKRMLPMAMMGLQSPAGTLTNSVQPGRALPSALRTRLGKVQKQLDDLEGEEVDTSALQAFARQQGEAGQSAMLNAMAAQYAGEGFQPMQTQFLKRAAAAAEPMKMGGGMLTPQGQFLKDPFAARDSRRTALERQALGLEKMVGEEDARLDRAERAEREREDRLTRQEQVRQDALARDAQAAEFRRLGLGIQQQGLDLQKQGLDLRREQTNRDARLPFNAVQEFSRQAGTAETMGTIASSFKPEYASMLPGIPGLGAAQNYAGRAGVGNKERANWWQNYNEQANIIRNQLFGSALTLTEKAAFEAAMISPDMNADVIQTRLNQQAAAAQRAYEKLLGAAQGSGYNTSGLPQVTPRAPAPKPGGAPTGAGALSPTEMEELARLRAKYPKVPQ